MIEFDDAGTVDDQADEELPQPPDRRRWGSTRLRRGLAVAAVVLAGGGIVTYAQLARPGRPQAHAPATTGPTSVRLPATPSGSEMIVEHLGDRNGTLRNDVEVSVPARLVAPGCPQSSDGFSPCQVTAVTRGSFVDAVAARFPKVGTGYVKTSTLRATDPGSRPGLWSRIYRAPIAGGVLTILVTRQEDAPAVSPTVVTDGSATVAYVRHVDARYSVEVELRVPTARAPSLVGLASLAADARLVAS